MPLLFMLRASPLVFNRHIVVSVVVLQHGGDTVRGGEQAAAEPDPPRGQVVRRDVGRGREEPTELGVDQVVRDVPVQAVCR